MSVYQAKSNNARSFELIKEGGLVGTLIYKSWFKFNATIEIPGNPDYQVEPKGFWGTTIELKEGEKLLLKFSMHWNGNIIIQTCFNYNAKDYVFKHRGVFKESFVLIDQDGIELLVMKPDLKWNMSFAYQVTTSDNFEAFPNKEVLLMNCVHCANYYMSTVMAVAVV